MIDKPIGRKRHEQFCVEVAGGKSPADAWRAAGFRSWPSSVQLQRLLAKPLIRGRLAYLRTPHTETPS